MTIKKTDWKSLRYSKRKVLRYGRRSIYDIIKDATLDINDKVDYIRHHYVYYEGNYEYFHDKHGKSNEKKEELNQLIYLIIQRLADPSKLKTFNKQILAWRKLKLIQKNYEESQALEKIKINIKTPYESKVDLWVDKHFWGYDYSNINLIREYLLTHENIYQNIQFDLLKYKELKIKAKSWKKYNEENNLTTI